MIAKDIVSEVREVYGPILDRDAHGTGHYEGCWKDHWACLAEKLLDHIGRITPVETTSDVQALLTVQQENKRLRGALARISAGTPDLLPPYRADGASQLRDIAIKALQQSSPLEPREPSGDLQYDRDYTAAELAALCRAKDRHIARLESVQHSPVVPRETPAPPLCDGEVRVIYEHGEPKGVRDTTGYLCFLNRVHKYDGQEDRYRNELALRARQAEVIAAALRGAMEPSGYCCPNCANAGCTDCQPETRNLGPEAPGGVGVTVLAARSPEKPTPRNQPDPYVQALSEAGIRAERDRRIIDRHVRWRKTAIGFLHQVIDGRGSEDEWPALIEFLERSDSRMVASSPEEPREMKDSPGQSPALLHADMSREEVDAAMRQVKSAASHTTENDFQHWLSYSGKFGHDEAAMRAAYYAGANVPPSVKASERPSTHQAVERAIERSKDPDAKWEQENGSALP